MRIALDHHYSTAIATELRGHGHDVVAAVELGWECEEDETLLALCVSQGRALLTNNVADFSGIARRWAQQGQEHLGLIFTSDRAMPRTRRTIGRYVAALESLLNANPTPETISDRVHWLVD